MTSVDELIRDLAQVPEADALETADLANARRALNATMERGPLGRRAGRDRSSRAVVRAVPLLAACTIALLIAGTALILIRHHDSASQSLRGPAAGPGAHALIRRLAVLRRAQTAADKLPEHLVVNRFVGAPAGGRAAAGVIIPSLSRRVATLPGAEIYLGVTTPLRGRRALWSPADGDLVTIISITPRGATEGPGYPAAALSDPVLVTRAGLIPALTGSPLGNRPSDAYNVGIVPDGVASVRWTFGDRTGRAFSPVTTNVRNNVAITRLERWSRLLLRGTWYAANGSVIPTSDAALTQAIAARQAAERRQALAQAERQHITVPAKLLAAFAVFSFNSPVGTRTADGYLISHPQLSQLPADLLEGSPGPYPVDLRQARRVVAPSGLQMWVVPGRGGICVFELDPPIREPSGLISQGAGSGCSGSLRQGIASGAGVDADNESGGAIAYGVVPRTTHTVSVPIRGRTHRTIHPAAGVYIVRTPVHFG